MSNFKFSPNLFIEKIELDRFYKFIDKDGFRNFLIQNSDTFGLIRKENEQFLNGLIQEDIGLTIKINPITAIDSDGQVISNSAVSQFSVTADNNWYWVKIAYQTNIEEKGVFSIDGNGNLVCTSNDAELKTILRGQPNYPSRIAFTNATNNILEYDVLEVINDQNAVLQGSFISESNLKLSVIGTFTPGYVPLTNEKNIFQYDSCLISLVLSNTITPPAHINGKEFIIGRVKNNGTLIKIEDKRNELWTVDSNYFLHNIEKTSNPLIGIEQITYDDPLSPKVQNIIQVAWAFTAISYSINLKLNTITINAGSGGIFKSNNFNTLFNTGDFDNWRLYVSSGKYFKIKSSALISSNIELSLENLSSDEFFSDIDSIVPIVQNLIITPDAEEIEIICTPDSLSDNNIVDKKVIFLINESYGKIPLNVYDSTGTLYNVKYRYKHIKDYSPTYILPDDTVGLYNESQFDSKGNLINVPVRTPYFSDPDSGYIPLQLNPDAYSIFENRIDLGDLLGVQQSLLSNSIPLVNLTVGGQRQYQYFSDGDNSVSNDELILASDLFINLSNTNVNGISCRNGNYFLLHFKQKVVLNGFNLRIVSNYINPTTYIELKSFTPGDEHFLATSEQGIFIRAEFDGSNWILNSVNETYFNLKEIVTYDAGFLAPPTYTMIPNMTYTTPNDGIVRKLLIQYKSEGKTDSANVGSAEISLINVTTSTTLDVTKIEHNFSSVMSMYNSVVLMALVDVDPNTTIQVQTARIGSDGSATLSYNKLIITE